MGVERRGKVVREFRTLMHLGAVGGRTDGQLLERYVSGGPAAEDSFAELVERHGPMVLRVCRSVLGDGPDALDAFQATFLLLVRRARSLCVHDSLGPWLYQVAWRVARCARSDEARRRRHERRAAEVKAASEGAPMPDHDSEAILHEELARLPDRYRVPLVLCDLEGQPHELAARHLGCAVGTIKSRLSRGREKLRTRLARRGLAPTAGLGMGLLIKSADAAAPAALVESTIKLAARQLAGGVVPVAVAGLAEGALTAMLFAKIRMLAITGLTAAVLATGVAVFAQAEGDGTDAGVTTVHVPREGPKQVEPPQVDPQVDAGALPVHEVQSGPLTATVVGRGHLESANNLEAKSEVEGQATITMILPEGTKVVRDQLVCMLDSAAFEDQLADQQIATERAQADFANAIKNREVAEVALEEYAEGILPRKIRALDGEIELARAGLDLERARLESLRAGETTELERKAAELEVRRAELALANTEGEKQLLVQYTKPRMLKTLQAEVEKAKADELAEKSAFGWEKEREEKLRRMIEKCKIYAPGNGIVVYHQEESRWGSQDGPSIKEGATVRERQTIFKLPDLDNMRVEARIPESMIDRVRPGMPARISVDAFPNSSLSGKVVEIKPLPDPKPLFADQDVAVYTVLIEITDGHDRLGPGMTASIEVVVAELDDVIRVPIRALLHDEGKDHVAVKTPEGTIEWRAVTGGVSDGEAVEITQGLRVGEQVVLDPIGLLSEEERRARKLDRPTPPDGARTP